MPALQVESAYILQVNSVVQFVKRSSTSLPLEARQMMASEIIGLFERELRLLKETVRKEKANG